jgi:uncharacterized membrane-anchored protein YitT (DUF2179 family)
MQMIEIDVRGLSCPIPVVKTKQAMEKHPGQTILVLLESQVSKENVIRLALIYRGSTGGLDIIAGIFHRLWGINFGTTIFITNVLVLGAALLTSNLYLTLYSALTMFVSSKMIDSVTSGFISKKTVLIVSKKSDDIANAILHRMHRGCTLLSGKGAYTGQAENIIMVTTGKTQVPHLKELIFSLDPQAFITITDTVEVYGRGFKPWDTEDV